MKTLLFINGPMGVGKTAVCKTLLARLTPGLYLDGDWCWDMNPFRVTEETRALVLDNITAMLSRSLACPELDYVIFGWVMHQPEIAVNILNQLKLNSVKVLQYTLLCSEQALRQRIEGDITAGARLKGAVEKSLRYLPLYGSQNTIKIMTDGLSAQKTAEIIVRQMKEE